MLVLTDQNFDAELAKATTPVLVDFYADWCAPCKMMAPHIAILDQELAGKAVIAQLDVDANQQTAMKFGIMSIPTTIIFKNGQNVKQLVGYQSKEALAKAVNEAAQ